MRKPDVVLFDLGNVLVSIHPERFLSALRVDPEAGKQRYQRTIVETVQRYEHGDITTGQYFELLEALFGGRFSHEQLQEAMLGVIGSEMRGMESIVKRVTGRARLALVSNTNEFHFNYCLKTLPVLSLITSHFLSYQLGALKPEALFYARVLRELSFPPPDILFVDDIAENVQGAEIAGMRGLVFLSPSHLEKEFKKLQLL